MSEQDVVVPDTEPEPKPDATVPMAEVESAAKDSGWNPEGEKTALEFLSDGRTYRDRDRSEIKDLKKEVEAGNKAVAEFITKQDTKTYATEQDAWEAKYDAAWEAGDKAEADRLRNNQPAPPTVATPAVVSDGFWDNWRKEEAWFDSDPDLQDSFGGFYQHAHKKRAALGLPYDEKQAALDATAKMKKDMPHKFKEPELPDNPNENRGSGADTGAGQRKRSSKGGLKRSDLTEVEVKHFDQFVAMKMKPESLLKRIQEARDAGK